AAAQKEIELTLAQLKEVLSKSTRVKQLESKLMALENKVSESRKSKNDSSEVSVRSSKLAELEGKVNHLTKQLENSNRQLQESLETSIRSDISEDLQAERRRASEWQDRCEMLRQSLADRETSASQDLQETRQQLRDTENKVKQLSAELAGVREANAAHLALGSETEVRQLKQQLQQLEAHISADFKVEVELRKARAAAAEAQLSELAGELSDAKAARTRTLSQFKDIDAEMEGARRRLEKAEREKARAEGERREAEDRALGLRDECKRLKKELHDTKHTMRAIDSPKRAGTICATARADALMEAGAHFASLTDLSTSTGEVDDYTHAARKPATLTRHGSMGAISASEAKAERAAGALDEARRELKRQQKDAFRSGRLATRTCSRGGNGVGSQGRLLISMKFAYADETAIFTGIAERGEQIVHTLQEIAAHSNLTLNYEKSVLLRSQAARSHIHLFKGDRNKQVTQAKYLGVMLSSDSSARQTSPPGFERICNAVFVPMRAYGMESAALTNSRTKASVLLPTNLRSHTTSTGHNLSYLVKFEPGRRRVRWAEQCFDLAWHGLSKTSQAGGDSPPPRRRSGVRLRIEQEAAERLSLGLGAGSSAAKFLLYGRSNCCLRVANDWRAKAVLSLCGDAGAAALPGYALSKRGLSDAEVVRELHVQACELDWGKCTQSLFVRKLSIPWNNPRRDGLVSPVNGTGCRPDPTGGQLKKVGELNLGLMSRLAHRVQPLKPFEIRGSTTTAAPSSPDDANSTPILFCPERRPMPGSASSSLSAPPTDVKLNTAAEAAAIRLRFEAPQATCEADIRPGALSFHSHARLLATQGGSRQRARRKAQGIASSAPGRARSPDAVLLGRPVPSTGGVRTPVQGGTKMAPQAGRFLKWKAPGARFSRTRRCALPSPATVTSESQWKPNLRLRPEKGDVWEGVEIVDQKVGGCQCHWTFAAVRCGPDSAIPDTDREPGTGEEQDRPECKVPQCEDGLQKFLDVMHKLRVPSPVLGHRLVAPGSEKGSVGQGASLDAKKETGAAPQKAVTCLGSRPTAEISVLQTSAPPSPQLPSRTVGVAWLQKLFLDSTWADAVGVANGCMRCHSAVRLKKRRLADSEFIARRAVRARKPSTNCTVPLARTGAMESSASLIKDALESKQKLQKYAKSCFQASDANGDGQVSFEELCKCMQKMNADLGIGDFTERHVMHYLQRFDTDGDELLNEKEFQELYRALLLVKLEDLAGALQPESTAMEVEPADFSRDMFIGRRKGKPEDNYEVFGIVGVGSFGVVRKVKCKLTGTTRVMKVVDKQKALNGGYPLKLIMEARRSTSSGLLTTRRCCGSSNLLPETVLLCCLL
ncbi:unnamed protein product, partial [Symbiodinium sp. CCMP2456]